MKGQKKKGVNIFLLVLLAIVSIVLLVAFFSPILRIHHIQLTGNNHYSQDEIIDAAEINKDTNVLIYFNTNLKYIKEMRLEKVENKIEELPYIKSAIVKYDFMNGLNITVEERNAVAFLPYMRGFLLIDEDGVVLETKNGDFPQTLIKIKGLDIKSYVLGSQIKTKEGQTNEAIRLVNTIIQSDKNSKQTIFESIDWVDVSSSEEILLSLENRIIVNLGQIEDVGYKIEYTKQILFFGLSKHERGLVDFTKEKNPSFTPES